MSESLAEAALAFCCECLKWTDARIAHPGYSDGTLIATKDAEQYFCADSLEDVLFAVRTAAGNGSVKVESQTLVPTWYAEVWLETAPGTNSFRKGQSRHNDPCYALLAACVAAARKVKEQTT